MERDQELCSRCNALSIPTLFYNAGPFDPCNQSYTQSLKHELGTLSEIWADSTCALCVLIKQTLEVWYGRATLEGKLRDSVPRDVPLVVLQCMPFDFELDLDTDNADAAIKQEPVPCYLEITFEPPRSSWSHREHRMTNDEFDRSDLPPMLFSLGAVGSVESKAYTGREVKLDSIDWDYLKSWIGFCSHQGHQKDSRHVASDLSTRSAPPRLRVIDVKEACIVLLPEGSEYVALSYQWGMDQRLKLKINNKSKLETPGFFDTTEGKPSRTIVDATEACRRLGYRYLWVDALSIIQDSDEDLQQNVDYMDLIYRNAELTIVGAAGKDAEYGFPGVSMPRIEQQMNIEIDGIAIANMLGSAAEAVTFSRWNTRGWTYQELVLSRRVLTFTTSQVFYHCNQGCNFQEQFCFGGDLNRVAALDARASLNIESRDIFEMYTIAVGEYTKRALSDPSDKLRAFNGLTKFLEGPFGGPFVFGLPVAYFDCALLWTFSEPCKRGLSSYPTWSWAGWKGLVKYNYARSGANTCEYTISQADISFLGTNVKLCSNITITDEIPSRNYDDQIWERHYDSEERTISYKSKHPVYQKFTYPRPLPARQISYLTNPSSSQPPILQISGQTATFTLTAQHSWLGEWYQNRDLANSCAQGHHRLCQLAILDTHQRRAGTVMIDGRLLPQLKDRHHKFIALSRSTQHGTYLDPSWDSETNTFRHWSEHSGGQSVDKGRVKRRNNEFFDNGEFDGEVWWLVVNVLLLSEPMDGVVERLGVGRVHVHAFDVVAKQEVILLG